MHIGEFIFNGRSSNEFNLHSVKTDSSFIKTILVGNSSIDERQVPFDYKPAFNKVTRGPFEIPLRSILRDENENLKEWSEQDIQKILSWLIHDEYKPLYFADNPDRLFYAMLINSTELFTSIGKGYLNIVFRTNSSYAYRQPKTVEIDATNTPITKSIICDEYTVDRIYPTIELTKTSDTNNTLDIYIDGEHDEAIRFYNLDGISNIKIYTKQEVIKNIDNGEYLYHKKNPAGGDKWLTLQAGENVVALSKGWKATISYQEVVY